MFTRHRQILIANRNRLISEMQSTYFIPYLIQEGLVTEKMVESMRIEGARTDMDFNKRLLTILSNSNDRAYRVLVTALRYHSNQPRLAALLEVAEVIADIENNTVGCTHKGGIIQQTDTVFVARHLGSHFYSVGLMLQLSEEELDDIVNTYPEDIIRQAMTMLSSWIQKNTTDATWDALIGAVRKLDLNMVAEDLEALIGRSANNANIT